MLNIISGKHKKTEEHSKKSEASKTKSKSKKEKEISNPYLQDPAATAALYGQAVEETKKGLGDAIDAAVEEVSKKAIGKNMITMIDGS